MAGRTTVELTRRIDVPTGGWWEIITRPNNRQGKALADYVQGREDLPADEMQYNILALLTIAWSWEDEINVDGVAERDMEDTIEVMAVVNEVVLPFLLRFAESVKASGFTNPSRARRRSRKPTA